MSNDEMRKKLQIIRDLAGSCPGNFWEETVAMIRDEAEAALTQQPESDRPWTELAACLYQACGAYDLPERILDVLSLAQRGEPFAHLIDGLLPCCPQPAQVPDGWRELIEEVKGFIDDIAWHDSHYSMSKRLSELLTAAPSIAEKDQ